MTLTPQQRRIIWIMREHGPVLFGRGTRSFKVRLPAPGRYATVCAYSYPEMWLKSKGLIEEVPGVPYTYRLTDAGEEYARKMQPVTIAHLVVP